MTKPNCIIIQNSLRTIISFRLDYILKLIEDGNNITIISPLDCSESYNKLKEIGCYIVGFEPKSGFWGLIHQFFCFNFLVLKARFTMPNSIYICHFLVTIIFTFFTLPWFNRHLFYSIEGLGSFFINNPRLLVILKYMLRFSGATLLFCNSDERKLLGRKDDTITKGVGIDLMKFCNEKKIKYMEGDRFRLLYVGRLVSDKGVNDVLLLLEKLINSGKDIDLTLIGDIYPSNPSSLSVKEVDKFREKYKDRIEFKSYCFDIESQYPHYHLLLLPSKREGFPVCVMEANASGLPSIVYNVPGCKDAVKNGVNGTVVPFGEVDMMARAVCSYIDHKYYKDISISSRKYAEANFDVNFKSRFFIKKIFY